MSSNNARGRAKTSEHEEMRIGRRAFLRGGSLILATAMTDVPSLFADEPEGATRVGLLTDLHPADKPPVESRLYPETLGKLAEAAEVFGKEKPDFMVELGDLIDAADSVEAERRCLSTIDREFSALSEDRHYVLGNHCVDTLTKEEFLGGVGREKFYYSFDRGGFHFVVLDSCFRSDGKPYGRKNFKWTDANVPKAELEWLAADLKATEKKVVVFAHQHLDVSDNHGVRNCPQARKILEASGEVLAMFQGHSHQNDLKEIGGIHYCTLVAMVEGSGEENNGYSVLEISGRGDILVNGFRKQKDYHWERSG